MKQESSWFVYILHCQDESLYTGMTNQLEKRLKTHIEAGSKAAKYTKSHPPIGLAAVFELPSKSEALKLEAQIKKLSRAKKLELCATSDKKYCENLWNNLLKVDKNR